MMTQINGQALSEAATLRDDFEFW